MFPLPVQLTHDNAGQKDILLQTGAAGALMRVITSQWVSERMLYYATGALANFGNPAGWLGLFRPRLHYTPNDSLYPLPHPAHDHVQAWCQRYDLAPTLARQFQGSLHQPPILETTAVAVVHTSASAWPALGRYGSCNMQLMQLVICLTDDIVTLRALARAGIVQLAMNALYMYRDSARLVKALGGMAAVISNCAWPPLP